ncbi:MAG: hypothetical protein IKR22_07115 [Clostridiales bacterium]|nr:hypothetical protein [Clostridiales bacterium]
MQYIPEEDLYRFTIIGPETDIHDRLHYHSLFAMLQEAACLNAERHGFGAEVMDELSACWLLLRMKVEMDVIPKWKDEIYIRTWSQGFDRLLFNRDFDIFDADKKLIGRATSVWVIAHQGDHRPVRPSSIPGMSVFETEKPSERKAERLSPIPDEKRAESPKFKRFADYSLIDRNMHVNNTHYVAWSEDACYSRIPRENSIRELTINYSSEVHPGEEVQLFCCKEDDVILVDGIEVISGRHVFTTRIVSSAE